MQVGVGLGSVPWTEPGVPVMSATPGSGKSGLATGFEMILMESPPSLLYSLHHSRCQLCALDWLFCSLLIFSHQPEPLPEGGV